MTVNNRYDIRIRSFSSLVSEDVVAAIFDEDNEPSFKFSLYPHTISEDGTKKCVSVGVNRYRYYPQSIPGLVEGSLHFTVSAVDIDGKERFLLSLATDDLFSLQWLEKLHGTNDFYKEYFLNRTTLMDQAEELLPNDVLTVRVELSYEVCDSHIRKAVGSTKYVDNVQIVKSVPECEFPRIQCLDMMQESLQELHEFFRLYADVQLLHEVHGENPELKSVDEGDTNTLDLLFNELRECFRLHRIMAKGVTGIMPYYDDMDDEQMRALEKRIWINKVAYHRQNVLVGKVLEEWVQQSSKHRVDRELEWYRQLKLVERRVQQLVKLFHVNQNLKNHYKNRTWWDRQKEDEWANERRKLGTWNAEQCMGEDIQEMLHLHKHLKEQVQADSLLKVVSRFFTLFLNTVEILSDLVFNISKVFFDWTQTIIERTLPQNKSELKTKKRSTSNEDSPQEPACEACDSSIQNQESWNFTIKTDDGGSHIVHFRNDSITLGSKLLTASPVFKAMLSHHMKESVEKGINLKNFDTETVSDFLDYVDSGRLREGVDMDDSLDLYALAHMYQVEGLMEECANHLYHLLSSQNVDQVRRLSNRWGDNHPLIMAIDRFYDDIKAIDDPEKGARPTNEPEFKTALKEWARSQRNRYDNQDQVFNFYQ